jgi:hypothetical protein
VTVQLRVVLGQLVRRYGDSQQQAVTYIVGSWKQALADSHDAAHLEDDQWTRASDQQSGRRDVGRDDLVRMMAQTSMTDESAVRQAFVLIMAWGSGTSNPRSYRNTAKALASPHCTDRLTAAASTCRSGALTDAYDEFSLPGIGRSFFTKWFAFAGRTVGRGWQPLILDDRVLATLNRTLNITTRSLAGSRNWGRRYAAYVDHLHLWSYELNSQGVQCDAERLEWILFRHNGKPA